MTGDAAFVFGGQGTVRVAVRRYDHDAFAAIDPDGALERFAGTTVEAEAVTPEVFQPLFVWAELVAADEARAAGHRPRLVLGQSLGELAAAVVAGAVTASDALRLAAARAALPGRHLAGDTWTMVAVSGAAPAAAVAAAAGLDAHVAAVNGPDDVVVSGRAADVAAVVAALDLPAARARSLPVLAPYHTPCMAAVAESLDELVQGMAIGDPGVPLLAATAGGPLADAAAVRRQLVAMTVLPVQWSTVLAAACASWGGPFIDLSPSQGLVRLLDRNGLHPSWTSWGSDR